MFYFRGQNFDEQVAEARRKHVPLYFGVDAYADTPSKHYGQGPLHLFMSAGELNKCRQVDMDPAMMKKMGVGHVYRSTSVDDKKGTTARYMMKLWWSPRLGWHASRTDHKQPRVSAVFDVPEDTFLKWIMPEPV